jgi:hypothetical protein
MKVFVSSLISSMEPLRAAARDAITTLRHEPIMAEDFGASANSPQIACLNGLRDAEVIILILGAGYGAVQASGLSATHEEYEEAKSRKPSSLSFRKVLSAKLSKLILYERYRAGNQACIEAASEPPKIYNERSLGRYMTMQF